MNYPESTLSVVKEDSRNEQLLRGGGRRVDIVDVAKPAQELISTQIPKEISDELDGFCKRTVRNKRATIARVLKFWLRFDDPVRSSIIGGVDRGAELIYADILEDVAKELRERHEAVSRVGATHTVRNAKGDVRRHNP